MRVVYDSAKDALLAGQFDLLADTFQAQMVAGYTFDPTHSTMADVTGSFGTPVIVSVASVSKGVVTTNDITFPNVTGTGPITGLVVYHDGTDPSSKQLLVYIDQRADSVTLAITPNGGDITFSFDYLLKL